MWGAGISGRSGIRLGEPPTHQRELSAAAPRFVWRLSCKQSLNVFAWAHTLPPGRSVEIGPTENSTNLSPSSAAGAGGDAYSDPGSAAPRGGAWKIASTTSILNSIGRPSTRNWSSFAPAARIRGWIFRSCLRAAGGRNVALGGGFSRGRRRCGHREFRALVQGRLELHAVVLRDLERAAGGLRRISGAGRVPGGPFGSPVRPAMAAGKVTLGHSRPGRDDHCGGRVWATGELHVTKGDRRIRCSY